MRVFGTAISSPATPPALGPLSTEPLLAELVKLQRAAENATKESRFGDLARIAKELAAAATVVDKNRKRGLAAGAEEAGRVRLKLSDPSNVHPNVVLYAANDGTLSNYHAQFILPTDLASGVDYTVSIANELMDASPTNESGWAQLDTFISPTHPHVATMRVDPPAAAAGTAGESFASVCSTVAPAVFKVASYGAHGEPGVVDASPAFTKALEAAGKAGGGTVYFERGQYWLRGGFKVPSGVYLKGEGTSLVSLYWAEETFANHSEYFLTGWPAAIQNDGLTPSYTNTTTWGMSDLTMYASAYYRLMIVDTMSEGVISEGFTVKNVRIRANAYFASVWGPYSNEQRPRTGGINFNFSQADVQGLITIRGTNWQVVDSDLLATGTILDSGGSGEGYGGNTYGLVKGNIMRNSGQALPMDQWKQIIVEDHGTGPNEADRRGDRLRMVNKTRIHVHSHAHITTHNTRQHNRTRHNRQTH